MIVRDRPFRIAKLSGLSVAIRQLEESSYSAQSAAIGEGEAVAATPRSATNAPSVLVCTRRSASRYPRHMHSERFVPTGFEPPRSLIADQFVLEPLGPQHNDSDHAAWTSSIEHIRATPGYQCGDWPPIEGMSLRANLADLTRHAADFASGKGFTFTVLDSAEGEVIGCVYLYPPREEGDVIVHSWVRADRSELDEPLAEAVAAWVADEWPWQHPDRCGR
jgi:hypothetical protein